MCAFRGRGEERVLTNLYRSSPYKGKCARRSHAFNYASIAREGRSSSSLLSRERIRRAVNQGALRRYVTDDGYARRALFIRISADKIIPIIPRARAVAVTSAASDTVGYEGVVRRRTCLARGSFGVANDSSYPRRASVFLLSRDGAVDARGSAGDRPAARSE